MRKWISLLLMLWLPLFLSTASYAASKMEMQAVQHASLMEMHDMDISMDGHCHMDKSGSQPEDQSPSSNGYCNHCGFCFSLGLPTATPLNLATYVHPLVSNVPWVSLPHTTSSFLRPPITLN